MSPIAIRSHGTPWDPLRMSHTLNEKKVEKLVKLSFNQKFCEIFLQVLKISVKPSEFTFSAKFERETHKIKSEKVR